MPSGTRGRGFWTYLLCSPVSRLGCIFNFSLHLTSSHITSLTMKHFIRVSLILCFRQKPDVLLKRKVIDYLFRTSFPCPGLPARLLLLRDPECCCCGALFPCALPPPEAHPCLSIASFKGARWVYPKPLIDFCLCLSSSSKTPSCFLFCLFSPN